MMAVKAGKKGSHFCIYLCWFQTHFSKICILVGFLLPPLRWNPSRQHLLEVLALGQLTVSWAQYLTSNNCRVKEESINLCNICKCLFIIYREWSEKEKISSERQLCGHKCLVDVRCQRRMDKLVRDDRKATVTQITTRYNQCMQNTISEHTTHRTLKQMGYSSRRPHRVPLLSAKNRKRRLQFAQAHQNWTIEDWKRVACSDESRFLLRHSDGRVRIWHKHMKAWIHSALSQWFRLVV